MLTRGLLAADLTRRHWTEETATRALASWRASGMSLNRFAGASGVNAERLRWWRKRLDGGAEGTAAAVAPMAFIPAAVVSAARVALRFPGGVELEGEAGALPAAWVAALARELGKP